MDSIEIQINRTEVYPDKPVDLVDILINGRNLIDIIKDVERTFSAFKDHPDSAGNYIGLDLESFCHYNQPGDSVLQLLQCDCMEIGCWPLYVRVTVDDDTVIWDNFSNPHRGPESKAGHWVYNIKFIFDRNQYEAELSKCSKKSDK